MKSSWFNSGLHFLVIVAFQILESSCSQSTQKTLPASSQLGSPQGGFQIARVITHSHTPYSYDACDKAGIQDGVLNQSCVDHLREALCQNHIDLIFISDHPDNMGRYEISDLLLKQSGDELLNSNGAPYANKMGGCSDGFKPILMTGFESRLLALGMTRHLSSDLEKRTALYADETFDLRTKLKNTSNALVMIPHTESRSIELIQALQPDGIEIYNIHANLDPRIRLKDLGLPPFKHIANILTYLVDPYKTLHPDFAFIGFIEIASVYAKKWNQLISAGLKVTGVGGSDAHENTFPQTMADGERYDSFRRILRMMSNYVLVKTIDPDAIKLALKKGQSWLVFEGFGSPVGFDYFATTETASFGTGESARYVSDKVALHAAVPTLHPDSPKDGESYSLRIDFKKVLSNGQDQVVASTTNGSLLYKPDSPGAYRAEVWITPRHLKNFASPFPEKTEQEYPWIVTNHIYLTL